MKVCSKCGESKSLIDYHPKKSGKAGYASECKVCHNKRSKKWREINPEKNKQIIEEWHKKHRSARGAYLKSWRKNNPTAKSDWMENNPQVVKDHHKAFHKKNMEQAKDAYIIKILKEQGFPPESITQEIIGIKRLLIKNKRKWLTKK